MMNLSHWNAATAGALLAAATASAGASRIDFGVWVEKQMNAHSEVLFGVNRPLDKAAEPVATPYRNASQKPSDQILLAKGLKAEYVSRTVADKLDMMVLWPDPQHPKYIIGCIEGGRSVIGTFPNGKPKYNPSVQRIDLKTGEASTILRGMTSCDPVRATPWGTVVAGEESSDGGFYEILDPGRSENLTIADRSTGRIVDIHGDPSSLVRKQTDMPTIAYEGVGITDKGVVYAGDELRPGTGGNDKDGGSMFKFVPDAPYMGGSVSSLDQSPLASGKVYAMQVSCVDNKQQYGQGCEVGNAAWIEVAAATARGDAHAKGATGYYRPEDGHLDPDYKDEEHADAVRFCWTNTWDEDAGSYGEVVCLEDTLPTLADGNTRSTTVNRFIEGDPRMNSVDNLEFQPKTGNIFVIEDHPNGEIWSCLDDGDDRDNKSDGCVSIASVIDPSAEPTGFFFAPDGETAYVSIQHSDDADMPKVDDYGTDDLIKITGFKVPRGWHHRHSCHRRH